MTTAGMTTAHSSVDFYKGLTNITEACNKLIGEIGIIGSKTVTVIDVKNYEKVQAEIAKIIRSFKNSPLEGNYHDIKNLVSSYHRLNVSINSVNPDNKGFFKKWFYNLLEKVGWIAPKFHVASSEDASIITTKLTNIAAKAFSIPEACVTIHPTSIVLTTPTANTTNNTQQVQKTFNFVQGGQYQTVGDKNIYPDLSKLMEQVPKLNTPKSASTGTQGTNTLKNIDAPAILVAVNKALSSGAYKRNDLEGHSFSVYQGVGKKDFTESFPLQPGQWFITDLPGNQGVAVVFKEEGKQKNSVYAIPQESLKAGKLTDLPKDLECLKEYDPFSIDNNDIKSWADQHRLGNYLETVQSANLNEGELGDLQALGLLKNCWECTKPASTLLGVFKKIFWTPPKDICINKYDGSGKKATFILRQESEGVRVWEGTEPEKGHGTLYKNRAELEGFLGATSVKNVQSENQSIIETGKTLRKHPGFLGIGEKGAAQLTKLKTQLTATDSDGEFYSLRTSGSTTFQLEYNWLESASGQLCSEIKNIDIRPNGNLLIGDKEYGSLQEYMDFDGVTALKSAGFSIISQIMSLYDQYRENLSALFSDGKIPADIAFWSINQEAGWNKGEPAVVIISQAGTKQHEFAVDNQNQVKFKGQEKGVDSLMKGVSGLTTGMNSYKLFKTNRMIDGARMQLSKMNANAPATVARGDKTYQIYTQPEFNKPNEGQLYVREGNNLVKRLKYTLRLNKEMQLTMIVQGKEDTPLVIGDYKKGGALGFQSTRLEKLLELAVPKSLVATATANAESAKKPVTAQPSVSKPTMVKQEKKPEPGLNAEILFSELGYNLYAKDDNPAGELATRWFSEDPIALVSFIANTPTRQLKQLAEKVQDWSVEDKLLLAAVCMVPEEQDASIPALDLFACHVMNQIEVDNLSSTTTDKSKIALKLFDKIKHQYGTNATYGGKFKHKLQNLRGMPFDI